MQLFMEALIHPDTRRRLCHPSLFSLAIFILLIRTSVNGDVTLDYTLRNIQLFVGKGTAYSPPVNALWFCHAPRFNFRL